ncbi:MAG: hypothetical protein IPL71_22235 [Anaerolineales bacterium]|uniref:hypothetical protein n=1 Tax=Candidatus Villigracilis proximus TaxID=3140683 RepID=UPI003136517D|nr:hypothetical protein [Anaerolineales bacterium]
MTDIFRIFFIIIALTITLAAYFLVIGALFTSRDENRKHHQPDLRPCLWLGHGEFLFFGLIAFVLLSVAKNAGAFVKGILTIPRVGDFGLLTVLLSLV